MRNPQLRAALLLAAVPLAALTLSLLLAFASVWAPPVANGDRTTVPARFGPHPPETTAKTHAAPPQPPSLWALLSPWVFGVDAIAVLGLAVVFVVRSGARRRRGARQ